MTGAECWRWTPCKAVFTKVGKKNEELVNDAEGITFNEDVRLYYITQGIYDFMAI